MRQAMFGRLSKHQRIRRRIEDVLVGFGYSEAYTWSLLPEESATGGVALQEPLSSEQAVLRTSLVDGLLASARRNVDAGNEDIALFEQAHVYLPTGEQLPEERWRVGGIAQGGFAFAKGTVEGLYAALGVEPSFESGRTTCPQPAAAPAPTKAGSPQCGSPSCPANGGRSSSTWMHS